MKKILTGIALLALSGSVLAGGLKAPVTLPNAKTLPQGVRNFNYIGVFTNPESKMDEAGNKTVLADPLFKNITGNTLIGGKADASEAAGIFQKLAAANIDPNQVLAQTTGQINMAVQANVPVFAYGLTKKLTAAIIIPITHVETNVDMGVNHIDPAAIQKLLNEINESSGASVKEEEAIRKLMAPASEKAAEYGYKNPRNEKYTRLGDIKVAGKYKTFENAANAVSITTAVVLPTGEQEDINKLVDVPGGDGQTDLELGVVHDFYATEWLTLTTSAGYIFQLADTTAKRIPEKDDSKLSKEVDYAPERDLGDIMKAELAGSIYLGGWTMGLGYGIQHKQRDKYSGGFVAANRYRFLEKNTRQRMQTLQASLGFDTISMFKKKKFFAPMGVSLGHTRVLEGKNVVSSPLTSVMFKMFF